MGVTGLWDVVKPVARPVKLETLNRKRLAVDASIWIYQFLKAVRDKEGNALRNSHVVGFFRRICKLLFFGIKPVFVFDGGAPILKRQTISGRKARREGKREDVVRTAGKLLAKQMQHRAEEDERKRREARERPREPEEEMPEELVYVEEQMMTPEQKRRNRQFKKKDAYHLPELDVSLNEMGAPNDPRIMSQEELEDYARQFHEGEDINLYDFSKIDFDGPFFTSLPATDRYNILNAARLRSRLRMGYSKEQLDVMFPNRMEFSKFQIDRVRERNELTQRLMNLNGMNPNDLGGGRVAGEKGKEYVLVKNDGVEGGWALGVVSNRDEGQREKPIDLDRPELPVPVEEESDDSFEDVPIEGLNRLPKRPKYQAPPEHDPAYENDVEMQEALFDDSRRQINDTTAENDDEDDGLFVPVDDNDDQFEDVPVPDAGNEAEDEELQRAIAMSLEQASDDEAAKEHQRAGEAARTERLRKEKVMGFNKKTAASGRNFANFANARAAKMAPRGKSGDDSINPELRAAFEAGRKMGNRQKKQEEAPAPVQKPKPAADASALTEPSKFKGPLPFESIDLGKSMFSKKKQKTADEKNSEEEEGGFNKKKEDKPKTPPPWFSGDINKDDYQHSHIQRQDEMLDGGDSFRTTNPILKRDRTGEVIDLDAEEERKKVPIELLSSDEEEVVAENDKALDAEVRMDDLADKVRAEPPSTNIAQGVVTTTEKVVTDPLPGKTPPVAEAESQKAGDEDLEWEASDYEDQEEYRKPANDASTHPAGGDIDKSAAESPPEVEFEDVQPSASVARDPSPEPEFEDVQMPEQEQVRPEQPIQNQSVPAAAAAVSPGLDAFDDLPLAARNAGIDEEYEEFSDPEDEQLMKQLAEEAEEHARFAAQLNVATGLQSAADYERELKQLRTQQKNERRDADEVTQVMITECQQLLQLFGLPYITAPMEAEAQCAELHQLGLVDGIVTDDSDIFLFGGNRVYKNMFNQAKEVQCYLAGDLEKEYGLSREKIIQIAHLLGSDYTEGIPNVGPVTALEILTEFGDLSAFATWWTDVQTGIAPKENKGFKKKFRKNATKIFLPPGFPDQRVNEAYLKPEVDSDPSQFQWGVPDLDALRQFLMATIGWSQERTDEILVPVIRDINRREAEGTQANITKFFGGGSGLGPAGAGRDAYAPRRKGAGKSSRMENALGRLHEQNKRAVGGVADDENEQQAVDTEMNGSAVDEEVTAKKAPKKRKTRSRKEAKAATPAGEADESMSEGSVEDSYGPKKARKVTRRRRKTARPS